MARDSLIMTDAVTLAARASVMRSSGSESLRGDLEEAVSSQSDLILNLIASLSALLRPLQKLESLVAYEELRAEDNPLVQPLRTLLRDAEQQTTACGIVPQGATVGEYFDEERHERAAMAGVAPSDNLDDLVVREVVRTGFMHSATGSVLIPTLVHAAANTPAGGGTAPPTVVPPVETPRGSRIHHVRPNDTLQGLALL